MPELYDLSRYFGQTIPSTVSQSLTIQGIRPLKSGSKFKVRGERGEFTFLYVQNEMITCFGPDGQFKLISQNKIKRGVNRTRREKMLDNKKQ